MNSACFKIFSILLFLLFWLPWCSIIYSIFQLLIVLFPLFWDHFDIQKHWATSAHKAPFKSIVLRCHAYNTTLRLRRRFVGHKKERRLKISLYWSLPLKLKVDKMWNLWYIFLCVGEYIGKFLYLSTFQVKSVMIINNNEDL